MSAASTPIEPGSAQPEGVGDAGPTRFTFGRNQRLTLDREYQRAFAAKVRRSRGPITVYANPNQVGLTRLGLSVGKRLGGAVVRNRFKRLIREAFRLEQHHLPPGYDLVVTCRPHTLLPLATYRRWLRELAKDLHNAWRPPSPRAPRAPRPPHPPSPPLPRSHPPSTASRKPPPSQGES